MKVDDEIVYIDRDADQGSIDQFMQREKGLEIVFNTDEETEYTYPLKLRTEEGWYLYTSEIFEKDYMSDRINEAAYDSIGFPIAFDWLNEGGVDYVIVAVNEGQFMLLTHQYGQYARTPKASYEKIQIDTTLSDYYENQVRIFSNVAGLWGEVYGNEVIQPHVFEDPSQIPSITCVGEQFELLTQIRKKGYDILKQNRDCEQVTARNKKTLKWGIFTLEEAYVNYVPAKYDSIRYSEETEISIVWNEGKAGFYKQHFLVESPKYLEAKIISLDYTYGVALKNERGWRVMNIDNGEPIFEDFFETLDDFFDKWLYR